MSKAAKQSILILIILLLAAFAFAGVTYMQKQGLEETRVSLLKQIDEYTQRETRQALEKKKVEDKLKELEKRKNELEEELSKVDVDIDSIDETMQALTQERDDLKATVENLNTEQEKLLAQIEEQKAQESQEPKIVYKYIEKPIEEQEGEVAEAADHSSEAADKKQAAVPDIDDESYWAQVLKEKATLELELETVKKDLTDSAVTITDLKKQNTDLQLALSEVTTKKESIEREIKYGNDLADSLALELARAKNDKKFLGDRIDKLSSDNSNLREQIKKLSSTKIALEKTIVRIQEEKKDVERKLVETENVIQSRIDEVWEIKQSLDKDFSGKTSTRSGEVELPPIVVASGMDPDEEGGDTAPQTIGFTGNVLSVNEENNFVIVDIGESEGLSLGEALNVYRGAEYVAGLEVIQIRKGIAAADIKNAVAKIKVGDSVK